MTLSLVIHQGGLLGVNAASTTWVAVVQFVNSAADGGEVSVDEPVAVNHDTIAIQSHGADGGHVHGLTAGRPSWRASCRADIPKCGSNRTIESNSDI